MRLVTLLLLCFASPVFAHSTEFVPMDGSKMEMVHTTEPEQVDRRFPLPIYFRWPHRDYEIIGTVYVRQDDNGGTRSDAMRSATIAAKMRGADAFLAHYVNELVPSDVYFSGFALKWKKK